MKQAKTNRIFARVLCVLLIGIMLLGMMPITSFAADYDGPHIELDGSYNGKFELNSNTDLLFDVKDITPGDFWTRTVHVTNKAPASMEFGIISVTSNLTDTLLFDELVSEIYINGDKVYDGPYGFVAHDEAMTSFYEIESGDTMEIKIKVTFPKDAGNAFMGKKMDSTWTFEARYYGSSYTVRYQDEDGVQLHKSKTAYAPVGQTVTENAVRIKGYKPDAEIKSIKMKDRDNVIIFVYTPTDDPDYDDGFDPDPDDPKPDNPKTGDDSNVQNALSIFFSIICIVAIVVTYLRYREMKGRGDKKEKK